MHFFCPEIWQSNSRLFVPILPPGHPKAKKSARARLSMKMWPCRYRDSHYKEKSVSRPSYLYKGNPIRRKTVFILRPRRFSICYDSYPPGVTHWGRDKITAMLRQRTFHIHFLELKSLIPRKFVCKFPNGNNLSLVPIMAWRLSGDRPLSETMMARFPDACVRHRGLS